MKEDDYRKAMKKLQTVARDLSPAEWELREFRSTVAPEGD
jgi:hypothetical protein